MKKRATAAVILGGILWGIISIFINKLSCFGFDAMQISLVRMTVSASSFLLFVLVFNRNKLKINLKDVWMFLCTGIISVVLFNVCYFYTIIHSQASVAVVLLYTSPIFIMILSAVIFKEKITVSKVIALVLTICGCVLVAGVIGNGNKIKISVILIGLCSGLFYGLYTIFGRFALKKYDSMTVTAYTFIFGFIGSLFIGNPIRTVNIIASNPISILWCIGIGIFCTVIPYLLYTWGLEHIESSKAAILVAVEPLVGGIIGMTVFNENHSTGKIIGIILILAAIIVLNIKSKKSYR